MKLSAVKIALLDLTQVQFILPNGELVPIHFHVTEVGQIEKNFIDCGGVIRHEKEVSFQLWQADDFDHRLGAQQLLRVINKSEEALGLEDLEVKVEYQGDTIGKYDVDFVDGAFQLKNTYTDCLAKDNCGVPTEKSRIQLATLGGEAKGSCAPGSGCC